MHIHMEYFWKPVYFMGSGQWDGAKAGVSTVVNNFILTDCYFIVFSKVLDIIFIAFGDDYRFQVFGLSN